MINIVKVKEDLTGKRFGRLTVIEQAEDYITSSGTHIARWCCKCDCGKYITLKGTMVKNGYTKSCGCLHIESAIQNCKDRCKFNIYDMSQDFGVGYASNTNSKFMFDKEDYDKICNYCWYENEQGYLLSNNKTNCSKKIRMHRLIMGLEDFHYDFYVDHINHNTMDNRKSNLRIVTNQQNCFNHKIASNNTSGITGVTWNKVSKKWAAQIAYNQKVIPLGLYDTIEEAIKIRQEAEDKYFAQYSYRESILHGGEINDLS